ncbi:hypothetical protein [Picosynechococcus sp. PCC 73109]|uniref:hypothetical protein n=2 Tax=unclassified Picosynechococcus TaxID=3079910 RepID=UPI000A986FBA|nr:hypothetical protein [Picosynechococcus sp. PCC 73109]
MRILKSTPRQLHIEFPEECTAQATLGIVFVITALLSLGLVLMAGGGESLFFLVLSIVVAVYCFLEKISYGCLIDRTAAQLSILRRNSLGQQQSLIYSINDIDTVTVIRNVRRGRPCSTNVCLKSGGRSRLMSYQSCAAQHQVADRITTFLQNP